MSKALREIKEKQSIADLFVVVLDARAPISTYNEEFDSISPTKPRLFVITKSDLADKTKLDAVLTKFNREGDGVIIVNLKKNSSRGKITKAMNKLLEPKRARDEARGLLKPRLRAMVMGVPNSGKSTLINLMAKAAKAKVGNRPGVTRAQQWINADGIQLLDTPGILWPKFDDELTGVKLAIIGSIKEDIIPVEYLYYAGYKLISKYYPSILEKMGLEASSDETIIYKNLFKYAEYVSFKINKDNTHQAMKKFISFFRELKEVTYD